MESDKDEGWHFDSTLSPLSTGADVIADGCGSDASVVVTDDGMFVFVSVTVVFDVCVLREDIDVDAVRGAGVAAVIVWVDSGRVFTVAEAIGFCSTGGEEGLITSVDVTGGAGGNAATLLGIIDVEEWL